MDLFHFADLFLSTISVERGLSKNTMKAYRADIKKFCSAVSGKPLCEETIIFYINCLRSNGFSESSIQRSFLLVKMFFRFLRENGVDVADLDNMPISIKLSRKLPIVLDENEVIRLICAPDNSSERGLRDRAILETFYGCGIRVGELCALNVMDVHADRIRILGKGDKARIIPVYPKAVTSIDNYLEVRRREESRHSLKRVCRDKNPPLFVSLKNSGRLGRTYVWKMVKGYAVKANISKHMYPHILRHSFATHLLRRGANLRSIQLFLGHENLSTTDRYTQLSDMQLFNSFHSYHPRP